jgi:hypothetical protein
VLELHLGGGGGARAARQQGQLGLDAQQFRDAPALLVALGARERLVDGGESLGDLRDPGLTVGQGAEEAGFVRDEAGPAEIVERGAEQLESRAEIAAPGERDALLAAAPGVPAGDRVPGRVVEIGVRIFRFG